MRASRRNPLRGQAGDIACCLPLTHLVERKNIQVEDELEDIDFVTDHQQVGGKEKLQQVLDT